MFGRLRHTRQDEFSFPSQSRVFGQSVGEKSAGGEEDRPTRQWDGVGRLRGVEINRVQC